MVVKMCVEEVPEPIAPRVASDQDVVYVHGRGDGPDDAPGDLVHAHDWGGRELVFPTLDADFYRQTFEEQVKEIDTLVGEARLAVGFSYGSWLLLTVVAMRRLTERPSPQLLLFSPILGYGGTAAAGLVAPYARELRRHLGLSEWAHWLPNNARARAPIVSPQRIALVHGADDPQCATEDVRAMVRLGYPATILQAGHRLDTVEARETITRSLTLATELLDPGV